MYIVGRFSKKSLTVALRARMVHLSEEFEKITGKPITTRSGWAQARPREWLNKDNKSEDNILRAGSAYGEWHTCREILRDIGETID